jgi:hypothetical protein
LISCVKKISFKRLILFVARMTNLTKTRYLCMAKRNSIKFNTFYSNSCVQHLHYIVHSCMYTGCGMAAVGLRTESVKVNFLFSLYLYKKKPTCFKILQLEQTPSNTHQKPLSLSVHHSDSLKNNDVSHHRFCSA